MKIGIVAHTARLETLNVLLGLAEPDLVSYDDGTLGATRNHRRTWEELLALAYNADEWVLVLEDDAMVGPKFRHQVERALEYAPTEVVSLYLGRKRPSHLQSRLQSAVQIAEREDAHWILHESPVFGVAVAMRAKLIEDMLSHTKFLRMPFDDAIGRWCRESGPYGRAAAFTWPSLVDHADGPSVIKRHSDGQTRQEGEGRVAWRTGARSTWNRKRTVRL